jgi:hypothetical protein
MTATRPPGAAAPAKPSGLWRAPAFASALLVALGFTYEQHAHFDFEGWPGAYGAIGLLASIAFVLVARGVGKALRREARDE